MKTTRKSGILLVLAVGLAMVCIVPALAQEEPPLDEEQEMPGIVEGTGTYFEITDSEYLNITLTSSELVTLRLESVPEMVVMDVEAAEDATLTEIILTGFEPSTTYYKYEDDYHNGAAFITDQDGSFLYTQDLTIPHLVFIQPSASTIYLSDSGWSNPAVGTWDPITKTGTLTIDVYETIQIDSDGITLDGDGYTVTGPGTWGSIGVYISGKTDVTIENLNVQQFTYGIYLYYSSNDTLTGNTASNNSYGIYLSMYSDKNTLIGNTTLNNIYGINFWRSSDNTLTANTVPNNSFGIVLSMYSDNNTLTGNTVLNNNDFGIQLNTFCSGNMVCNNNFIDNTTQARIFRSSGNLFNLPAPTGGNYWSNHTTLDDNDDGFVDVPYIFDGGWDNLPWPIPDAWLAEPCPTQVGQPVTAQPVDPSTGTWVTLTFESVTKEGESKFTTSAPGHTQGPPEGFRLGAPPTIFNISTTAVFQGEVIVGIDYSLISFPNESNLRLLHFEDGAWVDKTTLLDIESNMIYGKVTSFSRFAIFESLNQPPIADAGIDLTVEAESSEGIEVTLDGSGSTDTDSAPGTNDDIVFFDWYEGGTLLSNGEITNYTFALGIHVVTLVVIDSHGEVDNDEVIIIVQDTIPPEITIDAPQMYVLYSVGELTLDFFATDATCEPQISATLSDVTGYSVPVEPGDVVVAAGVFNLLVSAKDNSENTSESEVLFVVFDPDGGFVTGGGWIDSPEGAYKPYPLLAGRANFGFVSKYKKGANLPTGNTEFVFKAGDLNFHSSSYEWLVVTGSNYARFKGTGTINGSREYKFMLWAGDGEPDTFRIKIWEEDELENELVVYDNGMDQEIGGGSIVVHTK